MLLGPPLTATREGSSLGQMRSGRSETCQAWHRRLARWRRLWQLLLPRKSPGRRRLESDNRLRLTLLLFVSQENLETLAQPTETVPEAHSCRAYTLSRRDPELRAVCLPQS